jgi:hypothetical protein
MANQDWEINNKISKKRNFFAYFIKIMLKINKKSIMLPTVVFIFSLIAAIGFIALKQTRLAGATTSSSSDLEVYQNCHNKAAEGDCAKADFNEDGQVNALDFALFMAAFQKYDLNGDGIINTEENADSDFDVFSDCWLKYVADAPECAASDFDGDGGIGVPDFNLFKAAINTYDLNGDGIVNKSKKYLSDYDVFNLCWLQNITDIPDCAASDFDGNGLVEANDYTMFGDALRKYDLNSDEIVNKEQGVNSDFDVFSDCWRKYVADAPECAASDFDGDGGIGVPDFNLFKNAINTYDLNGDGIITIGPLPAPTISLTASTTSIKTGESLAITVSGKSTAGLASVWWWVEDKNNPAFHEIPGTVDGKEVNLAAAQNWSAGYGKYSHAYTNIITFSEPGQYYIKANARDLLYPVAGEAHQASEGDGIAVVEVNVSLNIQDGDLIKLDGSTEIYRLNEGKRDVIPYLAGFEDYKNAVMASNGWSENDVKTVSQPLLESYPLGENITIKENSAYLLKKQNEERYYIVISEATLSEVNKDDYSDYAQVVIPDGFFPNYTIGAPTTKPDFIVSNIAFYNIYNDREDVVVATICNNGTAYTFDSSGLKIEFGLDNNYTNWVRNNGGETMLSGACREFTPAGKIISGTGIFNISVRVDGENQIKEENENNNTLTKAISIHDKQSTCTDSDGGKNYYQKGVANTFTDYCIDNNMLREFYCEKNGDSNTVSYQCPNGCSDGMCIKANKEQDKYEDEDNNDTSNDDSKNENDDKNEEQKEEHKKDDDHIKKIREHAKDLFENKIDALLAEVKELRDIVKEQQTQIKYLAKLKKDIKALSERVENAINNFITYGVDENTKKLGAGERAAVIHSFKAAFKKLPETEEELADAIKIANGRWPSLKSEEAERQAKEHFKKIYKRIADMDNPHDNAAITIMAYGLRQRAENRNLDNERKAIRIFRHIWKHNPSSTEDWNMVQAIAYSGADRETDSDKDLLPDEWEKKLGTDPNNPDSDRDGYIDGTEVEYGYSPLSE